jgi:protein O-mannosyl-transferase
MPTPSTDSRRATALRCALVAVAAVLPYLNSLHAEFTFDDVFLIRDNAAVHVRPAAELLTYVYYPGSLYRPLTMLTYAANATLGRDPFAYHVVNLALHVLVSLAVLFLAQRLLGSRLAATIAGLVFAVHPIHTEAVTGVVGRAELLAALGVLACLGAFWRARDSAGVRRHLWTALALAAFAAAMLAKESAFTAIGLLAVLQWWTAPRGTPLFTPAVLRRRVAELLPYAAVAAAYLALRLTVVGGLGLIDTVGAVDNPLAHTDVLTRLRTATIVLWQYLSVLTVPARLSADYSFNQIPLALSWSDPRFLAAAALFAALLAGAVALAPRLPALIVAALFVAIPLALTANLLLPIGTIKGERLLYLPSVGWCLAVGTLAALANRRHAGATAIVIVALVGTFATRTWLRNDDWRSDTTLFTATLASSPNSAKANYNGGVVLQRVGRLDEAAVYYRRALEILPGYASAAFGIGNVYRLKRLDAGALHWYEQSLRSEPRSVETHTEIALLHLRHGELDAAEAAARSGLEIDPNEPMLLVCLSAVYAAQGDEWQSRAVLAQLDGVGTLDDEDSAQIVAARHAIEAVLQ